MVHELGKAGRAGHGWGTNLTARSERSVPRGSPNVTRRSMPGTVAPAHSYKFGAELQHDQAGDAPVLLRIETATGHGPASRSGC
jgi:hypothetical protein